MIEDSSTYLNDQRQLDLSKELNQFDLSNEQKQFDLSK